MQAEKIDPRERIQNERKAELTENLTAMGLKVEPYDHRTWQNRLLLASDPTTPDMRVELMYQYRGFSEAWFVGKRNSSVQRRRFPVRSNGRGFNYDGIAKAIREQVEQRIWLRKQIAETKKMLAAQDAEDAANLAMFEAERAKMVEWGALDSTDQRLRATEDGLHLSIEYRGAKVGNEPRLRVTVEVAGIADASDASKMIAGLKIAGLWL